jgi:UDP-glucose 4-epimerase
MRVLLMDRSDEVASLRELGCPVELVTADAAEPSSFERFEGEEIDVLFHLGGSANVPMSVEDPVSDFRMNVVAAINALEFARRNRVGRFVFPSTSSVYAPGARLPITEDSRLGPSSPYGAAKLASEGYCLAYNRSYGMHTVIVRFFNVYGPLMRRWVIHDLVRKLMRDPLSLEIMGDGKQLREYLYVDDAVDALIIAAEKGTGGGVYNAGTGDPVTIRQLAEEIIDVMGLRGVQLAFTMKSWPGDIQEWYADISKIAALGFSPSVGRLEGLRRTVARLALGDNASGF